MAFKMGYWVDLNNPYVTYENNYIESFLWWCLKTLHTKGYLYKSVSIQPYSPAAGTGLSSHELNQPGCYKNIDTSATVLFKLVANELSDKITTLVKEHGLWRHTLWHGPRRLGHYLQMLA